MSNIWKKVVKILVIVAGGIVGLTIASLILMPLCWNVIVLILDKLFEPPVYEMEEWRRQWMIIY